MTRVVLAAALLGATALPAFAGITCNLNDNHGNSLTYSFGRGGDGYATEINVTRNGATLSKGGPSWTRVEDKAHRSSTLWQGNYSIAYPWDVSKGVSVMRYDTRVIAQGACVGDPALDAQVVAPSNNPEPVPAYSAQPSATPTYPAPVPSASSSFSVPIVNNGRASAVMVSLGNMDAVPMLIDTGATNMSVGMSIANTLVQHGDADWLADGQSTIADGSTVTEHLLRIHSVSLGGHSVYNIVSTVTNDSAMRLLPFPILNQFGRFTIDTTNNQLTFG